MLLSYDDVEYSRALRIGGGEGQPRFLHFPFFPHRSHSALHATLHTSTPPNPLRHPALQYFYLPHHNTSCGFSTFHVSQFAASIRPLTVAAHPVQYSLRLAGDPVSPSWKPLSTTGALQPAYTTTPPQARLRSVSTRSPAIDYRKRGVNLCRFIVGASIW